MSKIKQYPYEVLLLGDNAPYAHDLNEEIELDKDSKQISYWEDKTPAEIIEVVQEIHDRYNEGSGWTWAEDDNAKEQQKPLKKVLAHARRQYRKHYSK